jgi:hypothetical protein
LISVVKASRFRNSISIIRPADFHLDRLPSQLRTTEAANSRT